MRQVYPPVRPGGSATGVTSPGNTAEPSGELSVGDIVAVGEVPLAVARAGWSPACGGLTEVRTSQYGTHPLPGPASGPAPDGEQRPGGLSQEGQGTAP